MNTYTVTSLDGNCSGELGRPAVLPEPGDILYVEDAFTTPGDALYLPGDTLELLCRTDEAPWGRISSLGNWWVKCKYGTSVWANIEYILWNGVAMRSMRFPDGTLSIKE